MNVLHLDSNHEILASMLEEAGFENHYDYTSSREDILKVLSNYTGLIIRSRFPIDAAFLKVATQLKFIGRVGAGLENIDLDTAQANGVACYNAPQGNSNAVGEHALGMLLSLFNHLNRCDRQVRNGLWLREENRGVELEGKTVGIIGHGNMGRSLSKKLSGFNCEVLCYDIKAGVGNKNATQVSLQEIQERCDVISLHTPQTAETTGMVNAAFIAAFKNPFYLINTARGKSVVTEDLVRALQANKISGAALDVLEYEKSSFASLFSIEKMPPEFAALLAMDNVLLSPHIAGWTVESKYKLATVLAAQIIENHA
jgi:D-3-phosphoglycerate dehydrogenase